MRALPLRLLASFKEQAYGFQGAIIPLGAQLKAWRKADARLELGLCSVDFAQAQSLCPSGLSRTAAKCFRNRLLCYGFGDDGFGRADSVFSGKLIWERFRQSKQRTTWQCEYIAMSRPDSFRLRTGAPSRPKGFYLAGLRYDPVSLSTTVSSFRKSLKGETGCGPEGIQMLCVTHVFWAGLMNDRMLPFISLADYDIAPFGHGDFFNAPQLFCSRDILGLGMGNIDRAYPAFGIPSLSLPGA